MIIFLFWLPINTQAEIEKERVLIKFKNSIEFPLLSREDIEVHHVFEQFSIASVTLPITYKDELIQSTNVLSIENDPVVETSEQVADWGYLKVEAGLAKTNDWTGKGVKIGIIDTGVQTNHPDLQVAGGVSFIEESPTYNDDEGHGTHVAGIIGAKDNDIGIVGVAPDAELYAIKSLNNFGYGNLSDVIAGIEWAVNNKLDIINLSLTTESPSPFLEGIVNYAANRGILIVAAAGNSSTELPIGTDVLYPARYDSVIAVGAIGAQNHKSKFSYFGPNMEFVAPGENVYSTTSNGGYSRLFGTSMAAPFVSGIAALYKQAYPELDIQDIRILMQKEAFDLGAVGRDINFGYGLVQAPKAKRVFKDVPTDTWYSKEIAFLYQNQIVTGYENQAFLPERNVTRAEAITMIGRALLYNGAQMNTRFSDVSINHYGSGYIQLANEQEIINGYPNGSFKPNNSIIRGDVATILQRAYHFSSNENKWFSDVPLDKYYYVPINTLYQNRIMFGYPNNTFAPQKPITRAEFSVMLARVLNESFRR